MFAGVGGGWSWLGSAVATAHPAGTGGIKGKRGDDVFLWHCCREEVLVEQV